MDRDIENDPTALAELEALGLRTVPVTVTSGRTIIGFDPKQLAEALQLGVKAVARDPSETLALITRALEAVERAVRQMPDDKLDWSVAVRQRSMREFTSHIFMIVRNTMDELSGNPTPPRSVTRRPYASFREIADYGQTVIGQFRIWAAKQDVAALRAPPPGTNDKSGAERLDLLAGHTIQHLRQLYAILDNFGITPQDRVPDGEWPPEFVLTTLW